MDVPQSLYRSLNRLVAFTLSCGLLSAAGFAFFFSLPRPASPAYWLSFTGLAIVSLGGMLLMGFTARHLRNAVQNERWPLVEVERWRRRTRSGWWHVLLGSAFLPMIFALLKGGGHHGFLHGSMLLFWPFFVMVQTLSQVSAAFRQTTPLTSASSIPIWQDWQNFGKLNSDHWRER